MRAGGRRWASAEVCRGGCRRRRHCHRCLCVTHGST
jgi:hypothetical protein